MGQRIKILVADNNMKWTKHIADYAAEHDEIELAGTASNGQEALDAIAKVKPDVVILNMILPVIDGLGVLEGISKMSDCKPRVICVSAVQNEFMVKHAFALGAVYFASMPIDVSLLVRRIKEVSAGMLTNGATVTYAVPQVTASAPATTLDEKITSIFLTIGIPAHIKGYPYLREAVKMSIEDISIVNKITKELYPGIAEKFGTTSSKVERAIRHAIDVAWNQGRIQNMNEVFGIDIYKANDRPTNGEFIALIADRLRMRNSA